MKLKDIFRRHSRQQGNAQASFDLNPFAPPDTNPYFDAVIATDLRFPGGASSSTLEEVRTNHSNGWRTGLHHLPSATMGNSQRPVHPGIAEASRKGQCFVTNSLTGISTKVLLFRHPSVVQPIKPALPAVVAENVILIINHPPCNQSGRIDYLLPYVVRKLRETYGTEPIVTPIGPLVRQAVDYYYDGQVRLTAEDWSNIFIPDRFHCDRRPPDPARIRIGRHSRDAPEKWPSDPEELRSAYPDRADVAVSILGGEEVPKKILGTLPANWTTYPFGFMSAESFLSQLDVFVYFHHPDWVEAFGRVLLEAMAAGLPVVVPEHFRPLLQEAAIYSTAAEVPRVIDTLRDAGVYTAQSKKSLSFVRNFNPSIHSARMARFGLPLPKAGA